MFNGSANENVSTCSSIRAVPREIGSTPPTNNLSESILRHATGVSKFGLSSLALESCGLDRNLDLVACDPDRSCVTLLAEPPTIDMRTESQTLRSGLQATLLRGRGDCGEAMVLWYKRGTRAP